MCSLYQIIKNAIDGQTRAQFVWVHSSEKAVGSSAVVEVLQVQMGDDDDDDDVVVIPVLQKLATLARIIY